MLDLGIHTVETAPDDSRTILAALQSELGFVPNMAGTVAAAPTLLAGFDGLRRGLAAATLTPVEREVVGLATGVAIGNAYGIAFHSATLDRLGVDAGERDRMRSGQEPRDAGHAVLYRTAQAIVRGHGRIAAAGHEAFTAAGFTSAQMLEVVAEVVFACLVGFVDNLVDRVALDDLIAPYAGA